MASPTAAKTLGTPANGLYTIVDADGADVTRERRGVGWCWTEARGIVATRGAGVGNRVVSAGGKTLLEATRETVFGAQR